MKTNRFLRTIIILLILALNIGCDQVSKTIVRHNMSYYSHIGFLNDHITFSKVENTGAFLSLGDSLSGPAKTILLNVLPLIALLFGLYFILTKINLNQVILFGIILIVGGGAGNLYDRMVYGSVTDFMHINFVIFQTGVFNVADMSIMAGTFIILIHAWVKKKPEAEVNSLGENQI
jgi:signal peptidase II